MLFRSKVATGTPLGICTMLCSESTPCRCRLATGTPSTGTTVLAASMPGRWAAPPAPAMITSMPRPSAPTGSRASGRAAPAAWWVLAWAARRFPDGLGSSLIQLWAKARKPAAIAFVIDTSSEVSPDLLQRVSRELASFARWESVSGDSLSLISTSTRPEMLASLTTDPRQFQRALEDLRPSGAAVPLDGMSLAFSSLESVSQSNFRTAVVLVESKLDANSATSFGALRNHFAQSLARSGTALYVVDVDSGTEGEKEPQSSDWLKTFAADLGAAYIQTSVADLPTSFRTVLQQVE